VNRINQLHEAMKIKVLHIDAQYGWRGGQQQVVYLLEGMRRAGWPAALVCQPSSDLGRYCGMRDLPCHVVRMHNEIDLLAAFRIAAICRSMGVHVIHAHAAHAHSIALWVKLLCPKIKFVSTRRVDFSIRNSIFSRLKYDNHKVDRIVCISELVRRVLIADGISDRAMTTIYSGVDPDKFSSVEEDRGLKALLGIPEDHLLVGTVAAVVGHKDYPNLLRAARRVIDRHPKISFCAIGDGDRWEAVQKLHGELQLGRRFVFTGYRRDVGRFLKAFDLFVLASREEGLGTSILDAQAMALPVVATCAGGIPEIVEHDQNGLLVPVKDDRALAGAILLAAGDGGLRRRMGDRARRDVRRFSISETVRQYLELYNELVRQ
jgi:glycosyltransferase involved in cell wall biosynthesis